MDPISWPYTSQLLWKMSLNYLGEKKHFISPVFNYDQYNPPHKTTQLHHNRFNAPHFSFQEFFIPLIMS